MKTLALRLDFDEAVTHPMHAFVAGSPEYGPTRLLQWNPQFRGTNVLLFYVDGPREPFLSVLDDVATTRVVEPGDPTGAGGFYLFVREQLAESGRELVGAFADEDVVVVSPVVYDVDGSVRLTVVGNADALQRPIDSTPAGRPSRTWPTVSTAPRARSPNTSGRRSRRSPAGRSERREASGSTRMGAPDPPERGHPVCPNERSLIRRSPRPDGRNHRRRQLLFPGVPRPGMWVVTPLAAFEGRSVRARPPAGADSRGIRT